MSPATALAPSPNPVSPAAAATNRMTVDEFIARHSGGVPYELVGGVLKEVAVPGFDHGKACARIAAILFNHVDTHDVGHIASNDTFVQTGPDSVRGADVLYYSYERLPKDHPPIPGVHAVAPDLVVEVKSPTDTWVELFTELAEYLRSGVRVVVLIDPAKRTISVYRGEDQDILRDGDSLTVPDVLPGFSVPVSRLLG